MTDEKNRYFSIDPSLPNTKHNHSTTFLPNEYVQLAQFDPVRVFPLDKHIASKLEQCAAVHGDHGYLTLMTSVDIVIREQLAEFIQPRELAWTLLALPTTTANTATA